MKKLLFIFVLVAAFVACSDDDNGGDDKKMPIENLVIPTGMQTAGENVILAGNGFAKNCKIQLRADGSETLVDVVVTSVTEGSLTFTSPENAEGKYMVILTQGGKTYELGEVTFETKIVVGEGSSAYGLVYDEDDNLAICAVDVTGKALGEVLFTLDNPDLQVDGIVADNHGKIYYKTILVYYDEETKTMVNEHAVYYYDTKTRQGDNLDWANAEKCFSLGTDGEKLYALIADKGTDNISLVSVSSTGSETVLHTYSNIIGLSFNRLYTIGGTFVCDGNYGFCGLRIDQGSEISNCGFGFSMTQDEVAKKYSNQSAVYSYQKVGDTWYEFNCVAVDEDEGVYETSVFSFTDAASWESVKNNPTPVTKLDYDFTYAVYDAVSHLIYGMSDEGYSIVSFNPQDNSVFAKWVETGCDGLFVIPE